MSTVASLAHVKAHLSAIVGSVHDTHEVGKALHEPLGGLWSARRGQFRVIYAIDANAQVVTVAAVDHGKDIYR